MKGLAHQVALVLAFGCGKSQGAPRASATAAVSSPSEASQATCESWNDGQEVRSADQALCRATKAGLPVEGSLFVHVREYGQTEATPEVGTHWMVYAVHEEKCGSGEWDTYVSGFVAGIDAATAEIVTPMPWPFEEVNSTDVPACRAHRSR